MAEKPIAGSFTFLNKAGSGHLIEYSLIYKDGTSIPLTVETADGVFKDSYALNIVPTSQFEIYVGTGSRPDNAHTYGKRLDDNEASGTTYYYHLNGFYNWLTSEGVKSGAFCLGTIYGDDSNRGYIGLREKLNCSIFMFSYYVPLSSVRCHAIVIDPITGLITDSSIMWDSAGILQFNENVEIRDWGLHPITPWEDVHSETGGGGGTSGSGGGTGINPEDSDKIPTPNTYGTDALLGGSASGAGFLTAFSPSKSQLEELGSIMWAKVFSEEWAERVFQGLQKPMDYIAGLSIIPITPPTSGSKQVRFAGVVLDDGAPSLPLISNQYPTLDCGTIKIEEYWGSALDYSPYTQISIFLPFIGTRELNTDDIMGKTLGLKYRIDVVSGICTAMISADDSVLYQYSGACAQTIPLSARDYTQLASAAINLAVSAVTVVASKGGSALAKTTTGGAAINSGFNTMQTKPTIQRAGAVSGNAGMMGVLTPYLIVTRPNQSLAEGYNNFEGFPSNITATLSSLSGFTRVEEVHIEGVSGTDEELREIETLLKNGVII